MNEAEFQVGFENLTPKAWKDTFLFASKPIFAKKFWVFIAGKEYQRPECRLLNRDVECEEANWQIPSCRFLLDNEWKISTSSVAKEVDKVKSLRNISYLDVDALAKCAVALPPTEDKFKQVTNAMELSRDFREDKGLYLEPNQNDRLALLGGDAWKRTISILNSYAVFKAILGATYKGATYKFAGKYMLSELVSRRGSYITVCNHIRQTLRILICLLDRRQFSGIRLVC